MGKSSQLRDERIADGLRVEIWDAMQELNAIELVPMVFKVRRLLKGKEKYGSDFQRKRDWGMEQIEELDDFINYALWERWEKGEGKVKHKAEGSGKLE